jgi:hypothetical protein
VGSNPTPSVEGAIRASGPPGRQGQECSNPRRPRSGMQSGFDSEPTEWAERSEARSAAAQSHSLRGGWSCGWPTADLDGWPSGLRRTIGNRVGESLRGFESHPVREALVTVWKVGSNPRQLRSSAEVRLGAHEVGGEERGAKRRSSIPPRPWFTRRFRGVAQSGRALRSGRRGPRFESGRPDRLPEGPSGHRRPDESRRFEPRRRHPNSHNPRLEW